MDAPRTEVTLLRAIGPRIRPTTATIGSAPARLPAVDETIRER